MPTRAATGATSTDCTTCRAEIGRAFLYALATHGEAGVKNLLALFEKEMRVAMVLTGAKSIGEITRDSLVRELGA